MEELPKSKEAVVPKEESTIKQIQGKINIVRYEAIKAGNGNHSAATRARVAASEATKLLKQFREEMLVLTRPEPK